MFEKFIRIKRLYSIILLKYGNKKILLSVFMFILCICILVYFSIFITKKPLISNVKGQIFKNNLVYVEFTVYNPTEKNIRCSIKAMNSQYTVVGYKILDINKSNKNLISSHSVNLFTTSSAKSIDVNDCWILENN